MKIRNFKLREAATSIGPGIRFATESSPYFSRVQWPDRGSPPSQGGVGGGGVTCSAGSPWAPAHPSWRVRPSQRLDLLLRRAGNGIPDAIQVLIHVVVQYSKNANP